MDNFKKFIQENKQHLDVEKPDVSLWGEIQKNLQPQKEAKKVFPIYRWIAAAACLILLCLTTYFLIYKNKKADFTTFAKNETHSIERINNPNSIENKSNNVEGPITSEPPKVNLPTLAKVKKEKREKKRNTFHDAEKQYVIADVEIGNFSKLINFQRQYISTLPIYGQKPSYFNDFKQQLRQMDNDEKDIRLDIKKNGLNPNQIESLINIYQQKITLLKQLNQEIIRINKGFSQNNSFKDSAKNDEPHFLNL